MVRDSPRFGFCACPREFLFPARNKEIHGKRIPEPGRYQMGLRILRGVYAEAQEEADFRCAASPAWGDILRVGGTQGIQDCRRVSHGRLRSYMFEYPDKVRCIECVWLYQGQERHSDCTEVRVSTEELHRRALLGQGILRDHGRAGRKLDSSVNSKSRRRARRAVRPDEARTGVSRHTRLMMLWATLRRSQFESLASPVVFT